MLTALLVLEAVLNSSERNTERRGIDSEWIASSEKSHRSTHSPLVVSKRSTLFTLQPLSSNNNGKMSSGHQSPASVAPSVSSTADNSDGVIGNNPSIISFKPGDTNCCREIKSRDVKIIANTGTHDHGSSKVKLKNIVDYKWEVKNYPGHLIAVHVDQKCIAYVINVNNKVSRMQGMVRVVNTSKGLRALIKGMTGEVLDLQFAYIENEHILASIDSSSLYVHKIVLLEGALLCNLIIKIEDPLTNYTPKYDKISWCPFIHVPGDDDEESQLIVWSRGSVFQCFNVNIIVAAYGMGKFETKDLKSGYLQHYDDSITVTWVAFSPDGSTLSVGSTDGIIRFYQVYIHDKEPRCLHEWKPYNGKPVSSFFFLDNLTKNNTDAYWKYAITGADNNTEFKVWDCGTWNCLQTISITSASEKPLCFIAELDRTSSYLVISSLEIRTCYVMQIVNTGSGFPAINGNSVDVDSSINKEISGSSIASQSSSTVGKQEDKGHIAAPPASVYVKSITEFPLNSGILSFSIVDAAVRRYKCANDNYMCDDLDDYDEESSSIYCVVVHMYIVQSKSMQECHILYQPTVQENVDIKSTISSEDSHQAMDNNSNTMEASEDNVQEQKDNDSDNEENAKVSAREIKANNDALTVEKTSSAESNALEILLGIANATSTSTHISLASNSVGSTVVSVAAAAAAAPSVIATEGKIGSRNPSPNVSLNTGGNPYAQVNLMTPDAFTSSATNERKTPENVSSEVLNTILMLAAVAGQNSAAAPKADNINLLNLVNNKLIEDQEQQKLQMQLNAESQKNFIAIDRNPGRSIVENLTSGGSSPSREVQKIMSLQEFDKSSFSGDELLEGNNDNSNETDTGESEEILIGAQANDSCKPSAKNVKPSKASWPKVPDVPKVTNSKHSAELQNAANLISQAVNASSMSNLSNSHVAPTIGNPSGNSCANNATDTIDNSGATDLTEINMKLNEMIDLIKMQSAQINNLKSEIQEIKKSNPTGTQNALSEFGFKLEIQLSKLMETYLKRYESEHNRKLSSFLLGKDVKNRELRDSIMQMMNQYLLTQFGEMVSKVMTIEIQRQLVPMLVGKLDNMQQQVHLDIAQSLKSFDQIIKDNIAQACKSKSIIDAFGKSVLVGVQNSLQSAFVESMSSTLIPAYEKSSQNMFKQLHEAFSVGIKEFMEQFDNYLQQLQPMHEATEDILNKFSGFRQHLDSILLKQRSNVQEAMLDTRKDIKSLELLLSRQIQETIRSEVRKSFESQAASIRSQANTPAPMYDAKESIKLMLLQGMINKAFNQALVANDLSLVEFTLKNADHSAVFTPNCCLEQRVLLSLIQQISADMSNHNEVKQNYLAEALLAINPEDPIIREHGPKVLQELFRNCQMFLINYPKSAQCSNVRMLMKAVQAYKEQF